jgi:hypothetical protein
MVVELGRPRARRAHEELRRTCARAGSESERGSTVVASGGFIGAGSGITQHGRVGPSAGACSVVPEHVEHVCVFLCPSSNAC